MLFYDNFRRHQTTTKYTPLTDTTDTDFNESKSSVNSQHLHKITAPLFRVLGASVLGLLLLWNIVLTFRLQNVSQSIQSDLTGIVPDSETIKLLSTRYR